MKVVKLTIRNYLGIKEAVLAPGKVTVLAGNNGQGKTSILKALRAIFKGTTITEIHQGTERAELIAELDDIQVVRVQTQKTASLTVKTKEGFTRPAPQTFLDGLFGDFAFNPLGFLLADMKEKRALLLRAMNVTVTAEQIREAAGEGVDVPALESGPALEQYAEAHGWFYRQRTEINRRMKQKIAAALETRRKLPEDYVPVQDLEAQEMIATDSIREAETDITRLETEKAAAEKAKTTRVRLEDALRVDANSAEAYRRTANLCVETQESWEAAQAQVVALERMLDEARASEAAIRCALQDRDRSIAKADEAEARIESTKATLAALPGEFDPAPLNQREAELAGFKGHLTDIAREKGRMAIWRDAMLTASEVNALEATAKHLDKLVEKFGKELPAKALAEAKLPIADLALEGERITVKGIPIEQLSTSEQIGVTLSIARALAKEVPLVCIDGAERLDDQTFAEFVRQAKSDGFQYFVTRVGEPREGEMKVAGGKVVA